MAMTRLNHQLTLQYSLDLLTEVTTLYPFSVVIDIVKRTLPVHILQLIVTT